MPLISFEASQLLYEVFVGINKFCQPWFDTIQKYKLADNLHMSKPNRFLCKSLGSPCVPSCSRFDPLTQCDHSKLEIRQHSLADTMVVYFSQRRAEREHWELFYECFHPKKDGEGDGKRTSLDFPDDLPDISDEIIKQTAKASLKLDKDDYRYWTSQRLQWAIGKDAVERRIGRSDWYWNWYSKVLVPAGVKPDLKILKAKHDLDEVLSEKYGRKAVGDESPLVVKTSDKIYPSVKRLLGIINQNMTGLNIQISKSEESKPDNVSDNEQKAEGVPTPTIVHHPSSTPSKPSLKGPDYTDPGG